MPMRGRVWLSLLAVAILAAAIFAGAGRLPGAPPAAARPPTTPDLQGFARALEPRPFAFPADHGPHSNYQTEWWYYTGNLETVDGRHFGFQLTFFRRALLPAPVERSSELAADQIYFAHFAVTDVGAGQHRFYERFSRGAAGLAGASGEPYRVWLEDWSVESLDAQGTTVHLVAEQDGLAIDLQLQASKPVVAHGDRGLSPKSGEPGNASYYLSFTRMETTGRVGLDGEALDVRGESWFDHEWSTSALGPQAVGWDWFSLQLDDGREIMLYRIRREDGTIEPVSGGTLVEADGSTRRLTADQLDVAVLDTWTSPETGGEYPSRWRVLVPDAGLDLTLEPWLADQEMRVSFPYWEGAVQIRGRSAGRPVEGNGYVELTGYAISMQGIL